MISFLFYVVESVIIFGVVQPGKTCKTTKNICRMSSFFWAIGFFACFCMTKMTRVSHFYATLIATSHFLRIICVAFDVRVYFLGVCTIEMTYKVRVSWTLDQAKFSHFGQYPEKKLSDLELKF